jgi:DNA-binding transcriptional regulator LsrR (DeoR family)
MRAPQPREHDQALVAARLYYVDGLPQADVARLVNVSQAKVSRLLAVARERGLVRITVADYEPRHTELEQDLKKRLGLKHAVVVRTDPGLKGEGLRETIGHFAAPAVSELVPGGAVVAIAGGRTLSRLVPRMKPVRAGGGEAVTVVQAMGNIGSHIASYDALELGRALAGAWGGSFLMLNTPAFLPDKATRDALLAMDQVRTVRQRLADADVALVGIGTPDDSVFAERGVLQERDVQVLKKAGVVGEICGRHFDARGRECATRYRDRVVGIGLDELKRVPEVIAVVAGGRARAIVAAVRGGLVKSLVIDQTGAEAVLAEAAG